MRIKYLAVLALLLAACSSAGEPSADAALTVSHAFVRATDATATAPFMTGAFMTITNHSEDDVTLTGAMTPVAEMVQVHEVVDGVMQRKAGGLAIPAGTAATLAMGGDHLMLMGMQAPVAAGDEVTLTLQFDNGTTLAVVAPVKSANAGAETYTAMPSKSGM